jgi:hypothetical protein
MVESICAWSIILAYRRSFVSKWNCTNHFSIFTIYDRLISGIACTLEYGCFACIGSAYDENAEFLVSLPDHLSTFLFALFDASFFFC